MTIQPKPAVQLAAQLAFEAAHVKTVLSAYRVASDAEALISLAGRASRIAVNQCNGIERWDEKAQRMMAQWTEEDEQRAVVAKDKIAARVNELLRVYGGSCLTVNGDPRGCVVRLVLATRARNGIGEGWGL